MNAWWIILISIGYASLLFLIAYWSERKAKKGSSVINNPYVYTLSLAVYCTAWTYFGSVGLAAREGISFLTIYLGPTLAAPLWWLLLRKIIRISRFQNIGNIADFISSRYGKNVSIGGMVAAVAVIGIIPYISLQIKAISSSLDILIAGSSTSGRHASLFFYEDLSFYLTCALGVFTVLFGTRHLSTTDRHEGMVAAVAFESIIKLIAFLALGVFVSYFLFDGFGDIFEQALIEPELRNIMTMDGSGDFGNWFGMLAVSFLAIILLPRQFQVAVVENVNERHLRTAMWLFPLYLFVINLFVLPLAFGGKILLGSQEVDPDTYVLMLPILNNKAWLAILVYLGGFSAATSMIIVSTIALSTMLSNNLILPLLLGLKGKNLSNSNLHNALIGVRRFSVFFILLLAYAYYKYVAELLPLVSIGLISFVAVAQFAPATLGGIFWKNANRKGALTGILLGFSLWFFTLVLPTIVKAGLTPESILSEGFLGINLLHPEALFGLDGFNTIVHGLYWSLGFNIFAFVSISLFSTQSRAERNQAEVFVDIYAHARNYEQTVAWKGQASSRDIEALLQRFLGEKKTRQAMEVFEKRYKITLWDDQANALLVNYAERLLAGIVGGAAARIALASVVTEEEVSMEEMLEIVKASQTLISDNKELKKKSEELRKASEKLREANENLKRIDRLKDEFITTVTHEMRTPVTSIRAFSEILHDHDLGQDQQKDFLSTIIKETERMERLVNQVLELEKFESGKQKLSLAPVQIEQIIRESIKSLQQVLEEKKIKVKLTLRPIPTLLADADRLQQVVLNLLSNAIKFSPEDHAEIHVSLSKENDSIEVKVSDKGKGIAEEEQSFLFDKFFQASNQNIKKPKGSGLGLAISRSIIELHGGEMGVESSVGAGATFWFRLPITEISASDLQAQKTNKTQP